MFMTQKISLKSNERREFSQEAKDSSDVSSSLQQRAKVSTSSKNP